MNNITTQPKNISVQYIGELDKYTGECFSRVLESSCIKRKEVIYVCMHESRHTATQSHDWNKCNVVVHCLLQILQGYTTIFCFLRIYLIIFAMIK